MTPVLSMFGSVIGDEPSALPTSRSCPLELLTHYESSQITAMIHCDPQVCDYPATEGSGQRPPVSQTPDGVLGKTQHQSLSLVVCGGVPFCARVFQELLAVFPWVIIWFSASL